MSKKLLLNEETTRRFMKLAGTAPLTTKFLKEVDESPEEEAEEGPPHSEPDADNVPPVDAAPPADLPADDQGGDLEGGDLGGDLGGDAPGGEITISPEEHKVLMNFFKKVENLGGPDDVPPAADMPAPDATDSAELPSPDQNLSEAVVRRITRRVLQKLRAAKK